jgi:hypothetical protein
MADINTLYASLLAADEARDAADGHCIVANEQTSTIRSAC